MVAAPTTRPSTGVGGVAAAAAAAEVVEEEEVEVAAEEEAEVAAEEEAQEVGDGEEEEEEEPCRTKTNAAETAVGQSWKGFFATSTGSSTLPTKT